MCLHPANISIEAFSGIDIGNSVSHAGKSSGDALPGSKRQSILQHMDRLDYHCQQLPLQLKRGKWYLLVAAIKRNVKGRKWGDSALKHFLATWRQRGCRMKKGQSESPKRLPAEPINKRKAEESRIFGLAWVYQRSIDSSLAVPGGIVI